MNEVTCDICKDLLPLVEDGVASKDSQDAVEQHIKGCKECAGLFEGAKIPELNFNRVFVKFRRKLRIYLILAMLSGISIGVICSIKDGGIYILFNAILMPVIGVLSFFVFRWKSLVCVPPLIFSVFLLINMLNADAAAFSFDMIAFLSLIFSAFAVAGILIAGLLSFAFGKDDEDE